MVYFFFRSSKFKSYTAKSKDLQTTVLYMRDKKKVVATESGHYVFPKDYAGWINSTASVSNVVSCVLTVCEYCIGSSFHDGWCLVDEVLLHVQCSVIWDMVDHRALVPGCIWLICLLSWFASCPVSNAMITQDDEGMLMTPRCCGANC